MEEKKILLFLSVTLFLFSCSTIRLRGRESKDVYLDATSFEKLSGEYKNRNIDSLDFYKTLYGTFTDESLDCKEELVINLTPIDKNTIKLKASNHQSKCDSLIIKGKYKRGYFKVNRAWSINFMAGPLLWSLNDNPKYIGLTKENKLLILHSGHGGTMFFLAIPIFAAQGAPIEIEYDPVN
jgi:hypothetical protein